MVDFIAPPHWDLAGRILALHVGSDPSIQAQQQQMGRPFTGHERFCRAPVSGQLTQR